METATKPQPAQQRFLSCPADIAIFGGSAGSGKTYSLLLEPLYHVANPRFRSICFRRTIPMLRLQGGMVETSAEIYTQFDASLNQTSLEWYFPSGAVVKFAGMEHPSDRFNYQGAQIPLIMFDELCQFEADQFWYLLSRCRSMSGIKGYVRGATNPDPDSWLRVFLAWWIDDDTGLPILARSGVLRWFVRLAEELLWADTRAELLAKYGPDCEPKSVTFIPAKVFDNKILLEKDPSYLANLKALPYVDRARLLDGNWNVRASAGSYFKREWFQKVEAVPDDIVARCRYWDRAATEKRTDNDPDATVGVLLAKDRRGIYYIENVEKLFASPHAVEKKMAECAKRDPEGTMVGYMQDPGSAGKGEAQATARALDGSDVHYRPASGNKETRAKPVSAQAEAGNVKIVRGLWNDEFLRVLENFPAGKHDDEVDALSGAHEMLCPMSGRCEVEVVPGVRPGYFQGIELLGGGFSRSDARIMRRRGCLF